MEAQHTKQIKCIWSSELRKGLPRWPMMGFCYWEVCKHFWGLPPDQPSAAGRRGGERRQDHEKEVDTASDLSLRLPRKAKHSLLSLFWVHPTLSSDIHMHTDTSCDSRHAPCLFPRLFLTLPDWCALPALLESCLSSKAQPTSHLLHKTFLDCPSSGRLSWRVHLHL